MLKNRLDLFKRSTKKISIFFVDINILLLLLQSVNDEALMAVVISVPYTNNKMYEKVFFNFYFDGLLHGFVRSGCKKWSRS